MLADSAGEDQRVYAANGRGKRRCFPRNTKSEDFQRFISPRCPALRQHPRVTAYPGQSQQAGVVVEHVLQRLGRHSFRAQQVKQDAGVDRTATGCHRQAVEGRESHRRITAYTSLERAQTCARSEVGDDDAPISDVRALSRQLVGDELIGQAMESEPFYTGVEQCAGNSEATHNIRLSAVERGIEARDLRDIGIEFGEHANERDTLGLMKRCKRDQSLNRGQDVAGDKRWTCKTIAAVHDPLTDRPGRPHGE